MILTYQFRIKDSSRKTKLKNLASKVNFVWNYLNETSAFAWKRDRKWLSEFDLSNLTSGSSRELELASDTIQSISKEFVARRNKAKRSRIGWRSAKRKLGWIPVKSAAIKVDGDSITFQKVKYRIWKTRAIEGKIKTGSFSQNSKGQWFINLQCEVPDIEQTQSEIAVGIDLGLKTIATMSDGTKIENKKIFNKYAEKLAMAQRARKKKLVTQIQTKIKNVRKDFLHKETSKLIKKYKTIYVGDVSSTKLAKTKLAKSVNDAGWGMLKSMLEYKAIRFGVDFKVVKEKYSTVTCSSCFERTGPSGLSALGVREFVCTSCGVIHDRDLNAATNILLGLGR
ncbi:MAG: transposase [Candidatus Pacebacteria bacterium]|nr:transposase [Candidatus Paceibacterota bacterium]